jgi:hypothetical protein
LVLERADLDTLRAMVDAVHGDAASRLAEMLLERGDLDGLRAMVNAGSSNVAVLMTRLLIKQGRSDEAHRLGRFGLEPGGSIANA